MNQKERISTIIREYDAQGWHRTGTDVDHQSARWLVGKAQELGLDATLEPFNLSRIDAGACYLEVDSKRIEGLPMYDGGFTTPEGIRGRVGLLGSAAEIGLGEITGRTSPSIAGSAMLTSNERADVAGAVAVAVASTTPNASPSADFPAISLEEARLQEEHIGIVAITLGGRPGLMATNAAGFWEPSGPPVLQVSSVERDLLWEHAKKGTEVHLVASARRTNAESFNVVGRLEGSEPDLAPIAVMTPRSGWWHCASERGGGLACWLEVMRTLCQAGSPRDIIFVATSAHELRSYGADAFLERHPEWLDQVHTWVHFGANNGAAQGPATYFSATDDALERQTQEALIRAGVPSATAAPRGTTLGQESQVVARRGARVVATVGGNELFHLESDRWPEAVDVDAVAKIANAFTNVAMQLASQ